MLAHMYPRSGDDFTSVNPHIALTLLPLYMSLTAIGAILNIKIVCLSVIMRDIRRLPCFVNFCGVWILWSLSYGLLLIAGHPRDQNPPFTPCVIQQAAIYGNVILLGLGYFALQLSFWLELQNSNFKYSKLSNYVTAFLLSAPYVGYLIVFFLRLSDGLKERDLVSRTSRVFYCTLNDDHHFGLYLKLVSALIGIAGFVFQVLSIRTYRRIRRAAISSAGSETTILKALLFRVLTLTVFGVLCILLGILEAYLPDLPLNEAAFMIVSDMLFASVPFACGLAFVTQREYTRAIMGLLTSIWQTLSSKFRRRNSARRLSHLVEQQRTPQRFGSIGLMKTHGPERDSDSHQVIHLSALEPVAYRKGKSDADVWAKSGSR